ncbi:DEAD/DEAH box helicase [Catenovulum sediminis]|uniref:DEAD/DEAH box helicase n=1 Tax=Catenovulum sediminis TaxID=1740262 RepID=UPI001180125F|nr:DEAD/DEAH box helicase [Catenovulum sediminis]
MTDILDESCGFDTLGLSAPILKAIQEQGYNKPSPIQQQAIPVILKKGDVMAAAQTGTGKTAGFTLPILQLLSKGQSAKGNQVRCLVLTPTRELAAQVAESVETYGKHLKLKSTVVFGGVKINPQMLKLRSGVDILVATPGRLLDLYQQNAVKFDQLETFVLDEADRMLDMGFVRDIKKIISLLPNKRQNLMFSATFSDEIRQLAKGLINNPTEISVSPANSTAHAVEQWLHPVDKSKKANLLVKLIERHKWQQALVFTRTKHGANRLAKKLDHDFINAAAIHGDKSQAQRTKALAGFKSGDIRILVATDIAARGLDIDLLPQVVNFDLPHVAEDYVHRIGRTGRAGASGQAISLVCAEEYKQLVAIERLIGNKVKRVEVNGFNPTENLPETSDSPKPLKAKKPKKTKNRAPSTESNSQSKSRKPNGQNSNKSKDNTTNNKPSGAKKQSWWAKKRGQKAE